ncbi:MAG: hypothetical protein WC777_06005 [Candidatus Gracilibacteria bacterium]|jgi:hypothetical protein
MADTDPIDPTVTTVDAVESGDSAPAEAAMPASPEVEMVCAEEGTQLMDVIEAPSVLAALHPVLSEALNSDAAAYLREERRIRVGQMTTNPDLERVLRELNQEFEEFYEIVKDPSRRLGATMGQRLMQAILRVRHILRDCGVDDEIMLAFAAFAMTTGRELIKQHPTTKPFNPEEFEREKMLQEIMMDLIKGRSAS